MCYKHENILTILLACGCGRQVADIKQIYNLYLQTLIHSDEILIALSP